MDGAAKLATVLILTIGVLLMALIISNSLKEPKTLSNESIRRCHEAARLSNNWHQGDFQWCIRHTPSDPTLK